MSDSATAARRSETTGWKIDFPYNLALLLLTAGYTLVYLRWYGTTALGMFPLLDGRETLALARRLAAGELGPEPFYAPALYPALLSVWLQAGFSDVLLPFAARGLNLACHVTSALCVAYTARRVWRSQRCGFAAGILWGINPVALHFAGDPLPVTLTTTLLLLGTCGAIRFPRGGGPHLGAVLICSLSWALAALTAAQAFLLIALAPLLAVSLINGAGNRIAALLVTLLVCGGVLAAFGYANYRISSEFRVTPWQITYDFWSANRPGGHGRFPDRFISVRIDDEPHALGRVEMEQAYREENPGQISSDYKVLESYWLAKSWNYIKNNAAAFSNHISDKFLYLLNNFEQFDNKTYAFQKQRSPWLAFNPVGWGLLLALAAAGLCLAWPRPVTRVVFLTLCIYVLGVLAFFVNAGARLPAASLLAVLAGWIGRPVMQLRNIERGNLITALVLTGVVILATFVPLSERERTATAVNDQILMARAATELSDYSAAVKFAEVAVSDHPHHPPALESLCLTRFRQWQSILPRRPQFNAMTSTLQACENAARLLESDHCAAVSAVYLWNTGNRDAALAVWYRLVDSGSEYTEPALQALIVTRQLRGQDDAWLNRMAPEQLSTPLLAALSLANDRSAREVLAERLPEKEIEKYLARLRAQYFMPAGHL